MTTYTPDTVPLQPAYIGEPFQQGDKPGKPGSVTTHIGSFSGAARLQSFRHSATASPSMVAGSNSSRRTILMKNEGSNDVFIGGEDVTISNGYRLASGDALTLEVAGEIWAITASTTETLYCLTEMDG